MADKSETAPTLKQIDKLIAEYKWAQDDVAATAAVAKTSSEAAAVIKVELTAMVEQYGARHTEKSKKLAGLHNSAITTTATRVSIDDAKVEELREYLVTTERPELAEQLFSAHTSYALVSSPDEKLKTLTVGASLRAKMTRMIKACFEIKTGTPSLKVELAPLKSA
jgi:hypothetical protein